MSAPSSDFTFTSKTIVVDSRDRDMQLFPDAAKYEISLLEEIQDVTSLELLTCDVPMVTYTVTEFNNALRVSFPGFPAAVAAALDVGDYSAADLAAEVQAKLCAAALAFSDVTDASLFRVEYVARTDNYVVRCKRPFSLAFDDAPKRAGYFAPTTCARLLGFGPATYESQGAAAEDALFTHRVRAPFRRDFTSDRYAILHIEPAYVNYNALNGAIDKSFAIIPRDSTASNLMCDETRRKDFKPPVARFSKVRIAFLDSAGRPYNFHNRDHRLELRFTSIRQKKYTQQTQLLASFEGIVSER